MDQEGNVQLQGHKCSNEVYYAPPTSCSFFSASASESLPARTVQARTSERGSAIRGWMMEQVIGVQEQQCMSWSTGTSMSTRKSKQLEKSRRRWSTVTGSVLARSLLMAAGRQAAGASCSISLELGACRQTAAQHRCRCAIPRDMFDHAAVSCNTVLHHTADARWVFHSR